MQYLPWDVVKTEDPLQVTAIPVIALFNTSKLVGDFIGFETLTPYCKQTTVEICYLSSVRAKTFKEIKNYSGVLSA